MSRPDEDRLRDILDAIDAITRYTADGKETFNSDELVQVWCLRHLEVIGEAASSISDDIRQLQPSVPWRQIVGMRNALIHGYFNVNWSRIWTVIDQDLQPLKAAVSDLLDRLENQPED